MTTRVLILLALVLTASRTPANADVSKPVSVISAMIDAAEPGSTVRVPPGEYRGNLQIRKPIVLLGEPGATLDGGEKGTVVEVHATGVTLRGFIIRGSGIDVTSEPAAVRVLAGETTIEHNRIEDALFGIDLREAPDSVIRDNVIVGKDLEPARRGDGIRLWWSHNCVVEGNEVHRSRDMVFWYSEGLTIVRNHVSGSRYGLHFMYSHHTTLEGNELTDNSVGVYLMYSNGIQLLGNRMTDNRGASGYGIGLKDCDDIDLEHNALLANRVGIYIDNSPSSVGSSGIVRANMIAFNEVGLLATPNTHDNVVSGNAFVENETQAEVHGRGALSLNTFSRDGAGNFWSDYAGFDRDGDGLGDLAYEPRSLFASMLAREPNLRLFVHSPAQQAIEFTARAWPELRPTPTLTDPAPLTSPPTIALTSPSARAPVAPMGVLGTGLLLGAGGLGLAVTRDRRWPGTPSRTHERSTP